MRLHVRHRTEYRFSQPQARLVQLLRVTPRDHAGQSVASWAIEVDHDVRLRHATDGYGNATTMLYVDGPIDRIAITVTGLVLTEDHAGVVRGTAEPVSPLVFRQSTPLTQGSGTIAAFVAGLTLPEDRLGAAHALAEAIEAHLTPDDAHGTADQRAAIRFDAAHADPQGAAHVLIAAAHAAGFPARYVAGHLHRPDDAGAHAAHGWAELHVDDYGWVGFDVHRGCCPTDAYVRVATGLDHAQAAPISGARIGGGHEALDVKVHVGTAAPQD